MGKRKFRGSPLSLFSFQDIITSVTGVFVLITLLMAVELSQRVIQRPSSPPPKQPPKLDRQIEAERQRIAELRRKVNSSSNDDLEFSSFTQQSAEQAIRELEAEIARLRDVVSQAAEDAKAAAESAADAAAEFESSTPEKAELEELKAKLAAMEEELTELKKSQRVFYNKTDSKGRQVLIVELFAEEIMLAPAGVERHPFRVGGADRVALVFKEISGYSKQSVRLMLIVHPGATEQFNELREKVRDEGYASGFDPMPDSSTVIDPLKGAG